jgi:transcriptional regulator with XRE-family HTH domain
MSYGYNVRQVQLNSEANEHLTGVRLGRLCIARNISVIEVARRLGASRQTVYNWFSGTCSPGESFQTRIKAFVASLG